MMTNDQMRRYVDYIDQLRVEPAPRPNGPMPNLPVEEEKKGDDSDDSGPRVP